MTTDGKFNVELRDGHQPLADDEPVFTFRALDKTFPMVLSFYADLCEALGSPPEHVDAIRQHRLAAIAWQERNGYKIPD